MLCATTDLRLNMQLLLPQAAIGSILPEIFRVKSRVYKKSFCDLHVLNFLHDVLYTVFHSPDKGYADQGINTAGIVDDEGMFCTIVVVQICSFILRVFEV